MTLEAEVALTAADRCDRCGARAVARATFVSGAQLLFCAHHLRVHEDGLRTASARISPRAVAEDVKLLTE